MYDKQAQLVGLLFTIIFAILVNLFSSFYLYKELAFKDKLQIFYKKLKYFITCLFFLKVGFLLRLRVII